MKDGLPACRLHILLLTAFTWLILASPSRAILDTNQNTLSDIWELDTNNGTLIPHVDPANPAATAAADPDADGWTNAMEAAAGTRHNDAQPPLGILRPELRDIPAVYQTNGTVTTETKPRRLEISWTGIIGKAYTFEQSVDLISWNPSVSILCDGSPMSAGVFIKADDGDPTTPPPPSRQFIRLAVNDVDYPDEDGLTNYEEHILGTDPTLTDTDNDGRSDKAELEWTAPDGSHPLSPLDPDCDKDGILDGIEAALDSTTSPIINNVITSPDTAGFHDPATGLPGWFFSTLRSYWTFEDTTSYGGKTYYPSHINGAASNAEISLPKQADPTGMISNAAALPSINGGFPKAPATALVPATSCTISFWVRCGPGSIQAKSGQSTFFALHNGTANNPTLALTIQKSTTPASGQILKTWRADGEADLTALLPHGYYLDDGKWRHIALVRDGNVAGNPALRIYIDGNLLDSGRTALTGPYTATSAGYFMIGGWSTVLPAKGLSASLDRFSVHASALSAQQITAIYNCDSEHDSLPDRLEAATPVWRDTAPFGVSAAGEIAYLSSPFIWNDPAADLDGDGLSNLAEAIVTHTDPGNPDSDRDLIPDGWEHDNNLDPNNPSDATLDLDGDGLSNLDEYRHGADPNKIDTDGDGASDSVEILGPDGIAQVPVNPVGANNTTVPVQTDDATDPADPADKPSSPRPADQLVKFKLGVGDRSGSRSEDYVLNVFRINPATGTEQRIYTLRSGGYGQYVEIYKSFKKGETYTFQIQWLGTTNAISSTSPLEGPDWDYHLVVEPQGTDTGGILIDSYSPAAKTINTAAPLRDPQDILPASDDDDNVTNFPGTLQLKRVVFLTAALTPDWNRDGKIDTADCGKATELNPWRFWINDDNDALETEGDDIPQGPDANGTNSKNLHADGPRDMIDFFAVRADLRTVFHLLPPGKHIYRITQSVPANDPCLRLIFAKNLLPAASGAYLMEKVSPTITYAETRSVTPFGPYIPDDFADAIRENEWLLLFEGLKPTTAPLELKIQKSPGNITVLTIPFHISISGVEDMYRQVYVMPEAADLTLADVPASPPNWPDSARNGKQFIFAHGYNVSGDGARGWGSDMFKKLFWSGNNAAFSAFHWKGNQGKVGPYTPDYQANLINAYDTAKSLAQFVALLPAGERTLMAHSMGNILAGFAMTDHSLLPTNYFMVDSAGAKECYDPTEADEPAQDALMAHPAWVGYHKRLRACEFHRLVPGTHWPEGDWRAKLTWRGRLAGAINATTKTYNFYSSGEEVLNNPLQSEPAIDPAHPFATTVLTWTKANRIWAMQEKLKGHGLLGFVFTSTHGGWRPAIPPALSWLDPDIHVDESTIWLEKTRMKTPQELPPIPNDPDIWSELNREFLRRRATSPFWEWYATPALVTLQTGSGTPGSEYARLHHAELLATAIPCTSFAAGRNPLLGLQNAEKISNIDMNTAIMKTDPLVYPLTNELKEADDDPPSRAWLHNDIREKAYLHNHKLFDKFVELGNLK